MLLRAVIQNLAQGVVALVWMAGLRRLAAALAAPAWSDLLRRAVLLPPLLLAWRLAGLPTLPERLSVFRADEWAVLVGEGGVATAVVAAALLGGTVLLFLFQEVVPALRSRMRPQPATESADDRLDAALARVLAAFRAAGWTLPRGRLPRIFRLEVDDRVSALHGFAENRIVLSRGLLDQLDDQELDGAVAHELAHHARGGNLRLFGVWLARCLQAFNPAVLALFREFVEAEEAACDAVAARVLDRPAALASAILKAHGTPAPAPADATPWRRARAEVVRRANAAATRDRVERLLKPSRPWAAPPLFVTGASLLLALLLWSLG